jgi:hypothetical protein
MQERTAKAMATALEKVSASVSVSARLMGSVTFE